MGRVTAVAGKVNRSISQSINPSSVRGADQPLLSLLPMQAAAGGADPPGQSEARAGGDVWTSGLGSAP